MFCRGKNQKLELFRDFSNFLSGSAKEIVLQWRWQIVYHNQFKKEVTLAASDIITRQVSRIYRIRSSDYHHCAAAVLYGSADSQQYARFLFNGGSAVDRRDGVFHLRRRHSDDTDWNEGRQLHYQVQEGLADRIRQLFAGHHYHDFGA